MNTGITKQPRTVRLFLCLTLPLSLLLALTVALCGLAPAQAQPQQPQRLITTFSYTPLEDTGCPLVLVKLIDKDHTGTFLLDTGTGPVAVTETMAAKLHLVPKPMIVDGKPFLFGGKPVEGVHLTVLQVGQFPMDGDVIVVKDNDLAAALGTRAVAVDGIIGANMLQITALLFDFAKHEITLWYPGNLSDAEVRHLGFTEAAVPLVEGKGDLRGSFTTPIQVGNGPNHGQDDFIVDTGANHSRLSYALSQQLQLSPLPGSLSSATTVDGPVGSAASVLETLKVGQFTISNHLIGYPTQDKPGQFSPSILGMDKLSRFRVLMDFPAKKMYLQPVTPLSAPATPAGPVQPPPPAK